MSDKENERQEDRQRCANYLQYCFSWLHVSEHLDGVRDFAKGGRVVVGINHQDVDGHPGALLYPI